MSKWLKVGSAVFIASMFAPTASRTEPQHTINCTLHRSGTEFKGTCHIPCQVNAFLSVTVFGTEAKADCKAPPRQRTVVLHKTELGDGWLGTMEGLHPEDPTRFEIIKRTNAVALRTIQADGDALTLAISIDKLLPPTADDIRIIQRARELLSDVKFWNRNDDRNCPSNPQHRSLFCALMQATTEVSGGVHYRQPALHEVREVLNEVGGNRVHKHRLKDYNNHPDTTLEDIHKLLRAAQSRLEAQIR